MSSFGCVLALHLLSNVIGSFGRKLPDGAPGKQGKHPAIWGKEGILPPASGSSSPWNIVFLVLYWLLFNLDIMASFDRPTESATRTTPILVFILEFAVSLSLLDFETSKTAALVL